MSRKKMGEILIEKKIISQQNLEQALQRQKDNNKPLGQILEDMDVVLEEDVAMALSLQFGFPYVRRFSHLQFSQDVLSKVGAETALAKLIFPLKIKNKILYLAISNPLDMALQSDLSFMYSLKISPCVATPTEIKTAVKKHYFAEMAAENDDRPWDVLLVDNQDLFLTAAEAALTKVGYKVYKARNGAEGLKIALQLKPHLIITDILMPRMGGVEMFNTLQLHRDVANIPVIALSAKISAEEESRLLEMGFFDFIAKPLNPTRLLARVRTALRLKYSS
ncbi:MAG: response regulator [Desulfuromusa sp.]|nr:response regulator [Desulfuromusa sp.]